MVRRGVFSFSFPLFCFHSPITVRRPLRPSFIARSPAAAAAAASSAAEEANDKPLVGKGKNKKAKAFKTGQVHLLFGFSLRASVYYGMMGGEA